ncbi:hypothetical protein KUTeg_019152 [Tegillarca granosa]|uniref:glutathione transferase n=1 Tax=Tegillarca granosa TaxID=220873 RepID=A0ABQ9EFY3_TEGGR|nr:hypothetical protein KUTeg_019152 [Tegillarca granosa]
MYSMRFCPFAERTRLVLAHKKIPHETVNINLKEKPEWFFKKNPLGLVPVLEKDGKVVYESSITCDYLDEVYPNNKLLPTDPYQRALDKIIVELFSKVTKNREDKEALASYREKMKPIEKSLGERGDYFGGSEFPELKKGQLRLYSMRFCPFAQRARLVLAHKGIPYETININLKEKPEWFLKRNPNAAVPVLEQDDLLLYESLIVCDYLDDKYPDKKLNPTDPYTRARDRIITITQYYKILFSKSDCSEFANEYRRHMDAVEKALGEREDFFGGKNVGMVDFMIWPWLERLSVMNNLAGSDLLPVDRFPNMQAWLNRMSQNKAVKETMLDCKLHAAAYNSWREGNPGYDFGLEE